MPIKTDDAVETIRFPYQHETDESFQILVEYHHTEIGPTVTLHSVLDSGPLSLPLSLYVDIVDYLRGRGAIPGGVVAKMATQPAPRVTGRLAPTRVAGSAPAPTEYKGVTKTGKQTQTPQVDVNAAMQQPMYAPQHSILQADGVLDPQGNSQKTVKAPTRPVVAVDPAEHDAEAIDLTDEDEPTEDPTNELDPAFSLEAGKARRAQGGGGGKKLKPFGKARNVQDSDVTLE